MGQISMEITRLHGSALSGNQHQILAQPGETVAVGSPVAYLYEEGEAVVAPAAATVSATAAPFAAEASVAAAGSAAGAPLVRPLTEDTGKLRATPIARRLAREAGLALSALAGSGPKGRIQRADVETALARQQEMPPPAAAFVPAPLVQAALTDWVAQPGDLHVTVRKGTGTPLVLIHGFAADSTGWMALERALPRDLPLIRIDLPSHGRSPLRRMGGFADLAKAVVQAFDRVTDGPVHLLGHSLGGAVALALCDIRPRQVKTLSLLSPAGLGPEIDGLALNGIARATTADSLAPWLKRLTARPDGISHDFAKAAMLARIDPDLRAAQQDLAQTLFPDGVQAFDLTAALDRVTAPTLMIWGRDDRILPWKQALAAPGEVALHLLRGVGHVPHMEAPDDVAALVGRHIR